MWKWKPGKIPWQIIALAVVGVALLLFGNSLSADKNQPRQSAPPPAAGQQANAPGGVSEEAAALRWYQNALVVEAERVLGQIRGSGRVVVSVTLSGGPESILAGTKTRTTRRTGEKDKTGVTRIVEEENDSGQPVIARLNTAGEKPVVTRVAAPQVEGVLIVSSGATDPRVRAEMARAAQVLFSVPLHKVTVLPMKGGE